MNLSLTPSMGGMPVLNAPTAQPQQQHALRQPKFGMALAISRNDTELKALHAMMANTRAVPALQARIKELSEAVQQQTLAWQELDRQRGAKVAELEDERTAGKDRLLDEIQNHDQKLTELALELATTTNRPEMTEAMDVKALRKAYTVRIAKLEAELAGLESSVTDSDQELKSRQRALRRHEEDLKSSQVPFHVSVYRDIPDPVAEEPAAEAPIEPAHEPTTMQRLWAALKQPETPLTEASTPTTTDNDERIFAFYVTAVGADEDRLRAIVGERDREIAQYRKEHRSDSEQSVAAGVNLIHNQHNRRILQMVTPAQPEQRRLDAEG